MNATRKIILFFLVGLISFFLGYKTKQVLSPEKIEDASNEEIVINMEAPPTPAPRRAGTPDNQAVYESHCAGCHDTGAANAPKLGDKVAWAPRIANGFPTLLRHVSEGYNLMPPKGTCLECSDADIKGATEYLIEKSENEHKF